MTFGTGRILFRAEFKSLRVMTGVRGQCHFDAPACDRFSVCNFRWTLAEWFAGIMYTRLVFGAGMLLHYSKIAKPHPVALRGSSKEFSHHGAQ
jgi:hypothetical protein